MNEHSATDNGDIAHLDKLKQYAVNASAFSKQQDYNQKTCFLVDISLPAGKKRMFMYDLSHDSLISAGLVAHGSCNTPFLESPVFSDKPGSGCSSPGKYAIGKKYLGRFGKACKLYGLDSTNNNAFTRNVVLLSYYLVTENEVYPLPICSSVGCIMTSPNFLSIVSGYIDVSSKPVLLWVFYKLI